MSNLIKNFALWLLIIPMWIPIASGSNVINVYSKDEQRIPLLIENFEYKATDTSVLDAVAENTVSIITNDLNNGGYVAAQSESDISPWKRLKGDQAAKLNDVKKWGYANLVDGSVIMHNDGSYMFTFQLWDVNSKNMILKRSYAIGKHALRQVAHAIADEIMFHITGRRGFFQSKIVYVHEQWSMRKKNIQKFIAVMDQDGHNHQILSSDDIVIKPSFVPSKKKIVYTGFTSMQPRMKMIDIKTGAIMDLSQIYPVLRGKRIISPKISPDGSFAVMSILEQDATNIYRLDLSSRALTKLTSRGINVSSSFSPNGEYLVFSSNMSGKPAIYIMNSEGYHLQRVSINSGSYHEPAFSPNGQWIAFTKIANDNFHIGIMKLDGSDEKILNVDYLAEGPTWSPTGREIAFSFKEKRGKMNKVKVMSATTGRLLRILNTPGGASDPVWIPVG